MQQETTSYNGHETIREAVGVFDHIKDLNEAVAELEGTAFPRQDISILNGNRKVNGYSEALADDPDTPRTILIRPEEKVVGSAFIIGGGFYAGVMTAMLWSVVQSGDFYLYAALAGGCIGAALGALAAWLLGRYYNGVLQQQIRDGRLILWVRTPLPEEELMACDIMRRHGGRNIHVHDTH